MPSPLGHALGAVAVGWAVGGRNEPATTRAVRAAAVYGVVGMAPDLDLLVGLHSAYTHSVGAVALVFAASWLILKRPRAAAAIAAAWASHILLDWLGSDQSAPIGIMALWPFSSEYYQANLYLFNAISRRYWLPEQFIWSNLRAALKEVLILGPMVVFSYGVTFRKRRN